MSILGNINNLIDEEEENTGYTTPVVIKDSKDYISLKKASALSLGLHISAALGIVLITYALMLLGINLFKFDRPQPKQDIEFVLVERKAPPINKKTPYRSDRDSQAGGKHDPKRKVSMPSPQPAKSAKPAAPSAPKKAPAKQPQKAAQSPVKPMAKPVAKPSTQSKPTPQPAKTNVAPKPAPPSVKPSATPVATPKITTTTPKTPITVPAPSTSNVGKLSTGPVGGSGTSSSRPVGGGYAPTPSLAPTYKPSTGAGSGSGSSASRGGSGNIGNPGPGNPNGRPGIDTVAAPDFGPYMRDLQRRIKMNWDPPKGNESKRVVLLFKIARDGRLLSCRVLTSSGLPSADNAALNAVKLTAPFRPLPVNFKGDSVDIQFTFDYNVFGASYR